MTTTELITPPRVPIPLEPWSEEHRHARLAASVHPTVGEMLEEADDLVEFVPVAGPPVVLVLGPWVLLVLMLAGPFAVLVTFVVALLAAAAVVGLIGAIVASPFLLFRHLRGYRARRASRRASTVQVVPINSLRVAS
jgi:hypothetical protein